MSGTPIEMSMAHVVTFVDGKQTRTDNYSDPHEALKYRSAWRSRHVPVGLAGARRTGTG